MKDSENLVGCSWYMRYFMMPMGRYKSHALVGNSLESLVKSFRCSETSRTNHFAVEENVAARAMRCLCGILCGEASIPCRPASGCKNSRLTAR